MTYETCPRLYKNENVDCEIYLQCILMIICLQIKTFTNQDFFFCNFNFLKNDIFMLVRKHYG